MTGQTLSPNVTRYYNYSAKMQTYITEISTSLVTRLQITNDIISANEVT
jgi:hypothetical protein